MTAVNVQQADSGKHLVVHYLCRCQGDFEFTFVGRAIEAVFGYEPEECLNDSEFWFSHVHPEDRPALRAALESAAADGGWASDYRLRSASGDWLWIHDEATAVTDASGEVSSYVGSWTDITMVKLAQGPDLSSEGLYKEAQRIAKVGHWVWNIVEDTLEWSDEVYRMFGIEIQSFTPTYEEFIEYVHPDDRELVTARVAGALYEDQPYSCDHKILLPNGIEKTVHERAEVTFDDRGRPIRMAGTVMDVTERKNTENMLRQLTERVAETETRERRALAMALHDTIAQDLALSILKLSCLRECTKDSQYRDELGVVVDMLHESSTSLRGTIFELSSPILYELGIEAALRTLCEQLTTRHGFACHITRIGETGHLLDATRAVLYQCSREILMNIAKHAKASNAWITIEVTTAIVRIEITDDGVGIDPGQQSSGIGLLYVEERMSNIGGYLAIEPAKSGGLRCQLIVNLE